MAAYRPNVFPASGDIYRDLDYALLPPSSEDYVLIVQQIEGEIRERKIRFADLVPPVTSAVFPNVVQLENNPIIQQQVRSFYYTVTQDDLDHGGFNLGVTPNQGQDVSIIPQGGIAQVFGIDFDIQGTWVIWQQLALELLVDVGTILMISVVLGS